MDDQLPQAELSAADQHFSELAKLEKQSQEYLDGWKRAKADYLNLKKQTDKEKQEIAQFAGATTILQFLPIYTNFNLALKHIPAEQQSQEWVQGVMHIQKQFTDILKAIGLEPIPTVGEQFSPSLHYAVNTVKQDGMASGTILSELKAGWKMGDKVIEPAQVTVAE